MFLTMISNPQCGKNLTGFLKTLSPHSYLIPQSNTGNPGCSKKWILFFIKIKNSSSSKLWVGIILD
jgi:hypothetical protein